MTVINLRFAIGSRIVFRDKTNLRLEPRLGKVIGHDPSPPRKTKRKNPCYIIQPDGGEPSEYREEDEVDIPPDEAVVKRECQRYVDKSRKEAETDTVEIPLREKSED